jgi:hypothetical protein
MDVPTLMRTLTPAPSIDPDWEDVRRRAQQRRRRRHRPVVAVLIAAALVPALAYGGLQLVSRGGSDLHGSGGSEAIGLTARFDGHQIRTFSPVGQKGRRFGGLRWTLRIDQTTATPISAYLRVYGSPSSIALRLCGPCKPTNGGILLRRGLWLSILAHQHRHPAQIELHAGDRTLRFEVHR